MEKDIAPFNTFEVTKTALGEVLAEQLKLVRKVDENMRQCQDNQRWIAVVAFACVSLVPVWFFGIKAYAASHIGWSVWSAWGSMACWAAALWIAGAVMLAVAVAAHAEFNTRNQKVEDAVTWLFVLLTVIACGILFFPVLPLVPLGISVILWFANRSPDDPAENLTCEAVKTDNRTTEYRSFLAHISAWNDCAQFLNRLRLKIEHRQIPESLVPQALAGLEAMRAEECLLFDRLKYMQALANEGPLGTQSARAQLGAALVHDLAEPVHHMRQQIAKLRELDAQSIAALQVETNTL